MHKELKLKLINYIGEKASGKQYYEYFISDVPLIDFLSIENKSFVTPFGFFLNVEEENRAKDEFTFKSFSQLKNNRIEIYICEMCGDIGCGAITAELLQTEDKIIWKNFAYQSNFDEVDEYIEMKEIEFEKQNYFEAFSLI